MEFAASSGSILSLKSSCEENCELGGYCRAALKSRIASLYVSILFRDLTTISERLLLEMRGTQLAISVALYCSRLHWA